MPRTRKRVDETEKSSVWGSYFPYILGLAILGTAGFFVISTQQPPTDSKFCPENEKGLGITAFIVDVSDKLTNSQTARLENELENISNVSSERPSAFLEKGEKMLVYFVKSEGQDLHPVFDLCHPGDVANRTWDQKATEGKFFAQKKWEKFKHDMMSDITREIDNSTGANTSPIIETIQYIRDKNFPPPDLMDKTTNYRIVLWSDMLQHSKEASHFRGLGDSKTVLKRKPLRLDGVDVWVFYLVSEKYSDYQTGEHMTWWREIFSLSQARLKAIRPL